MLRRILRRLVIALALSAAGGIASARADSGDEQFALAAGHYAHKRWPEACEAFDKMLENHPEHARANQARFFYGEALAQANRAGDARLQFAELLRRDPEHRYARQALFRSGELAYMSGDTATAQSDLAAFRERYPQDALSAYALPYLGSLELQAGHSAAAEPLFTETLQRFPNGPLADECRLGQARAQQLGGNRSQARRSYRALVDGRGPLAREAAVQWGALENGAGEFAAALTAFDRVAQQTPADALDGKTRIGRGYALYKLGRNEEAGKTLAALVDHPVLKVEARYWRGLAQKAQQKWAEASSTLADAGALDPAHPLAAAIAYEAADALLQAGQHAEAQVAFDRALQLWPQGTWADDCWYGKVRAAGLAGQHVEAVELASELADRFSESPLRPHAALAKGRALAELAQHAAARSAAGAAIDAPLSSAWTVGEQSQAIALAAVCDARLGEFDESQKWLTQLDGHATSGALAAETRYQVAELAYAAEKFDLAKSLFLELAGSQEPQTARRGLTGLGWCQFQTRKWADSAAAFEKLAARFPDHAAAAEALLMRARALEHLEQSEAALAAYSDLVKRYPASERVADALWRAAQLRQRRHEAPQAMELYANLIKNHASFTELDGAMFHHANLLEQSGDRSAAGELYARLRRDFPSSRYLADAILREAEQALAAGQHDVAKELLTKVALPDAGESVLARAWYLQARLAMASQDWAAAREPILRLVERYPANALVPRANYLLAEASFRQGNYDDAARGFASLAEITDGQSASLAAMAAFRRAQALAQLKEWDQALEVAGTIATRFAGFEQQGEVDYLMGRALTAKAEFKAAREAFARVISTQRAKPTEVAARAQWMIGESYFHQEDYKSAMIEFAKVDERYPFPRWQAAAMVERGKCHEQLGQWSAAVGIYQRLLKEHAASEFQSEATERLAAAQKRLANKSAPAKPR